MAALTPCTRESQGMAMSIERFQRGIGTVWAFEPHKKARTYCPLWRARHPARNEQRCQFNDSNGALELPNGAGVLTLVAWLLWMLQLVNVT